MSGFLGMALLALLLGACTAKDSAHAEFWVRGNCEMCQATIEKALGGTPGVLSAKYDLDKHMAVVDYDSTKVTAAQLEAACAGAGYETKGAPAIATAYDALPKCCKRPEDQ